MNKMKNLLAALLFATLTTPALAAVTDNQVFTYAEANYASLFSGASQSGQFQQYNYRYYPATKNYLAVDSAKTIYILGPVSNGNIQSVGPVSAFEGLITTWEAKQLAVSGSTGGATPGSAASKATAGSLAILGIWDVTVTGSITENGGTQQVNESIPGVPGTPTVPDAATLQATMDQAFGPGVTATITRSFNTATQQTFVITGSRTTGANPGYGTLTFTFTQRAAGNGTGGGAATGGATGLTFTPAFNGTSTFTNSAPMVVGSIFLFSQNNYQQQFSVTYTPLSGSTPEGLTITTTAVANSNVQAALVNQVTSANNLTTTCVLTTHTLLPTCSKAGIAFNKSTGNISFTNTPMAINIGSTAPQPTAFTLNGSLTFPPF